MKKLITILLSLAFLAGAIAFAPPEDMTKGHKGGKTVKTEGKKGMDTSKGGDDKGGKKGSDKAKGGDKDKDHPKSTAKKK